MRLWSIHPRYLDSAGLVALWREGLLAKRVLQGRTKGYRHHPQLVRFQRQHSPVASINSYLRSVWRESVRRGYSFDKRKLGRQRRVAPIPISSGQIRYESAHLRRKLKARDRERYRAMERLKRTIPHPLFKVRTGPVASWEKPG